MAGDTDSSLGRINVVASKISQEIKRAGDEFALRMVSRRVCCVIASVCLHSGFGNHVSNWTNCGHVRVASSELGQLGNFVPAYFCHVPIACIPVAASVQFHTHTECLFYITRGNFKQ